MRHKKLSAGIALVFLCAAIASAQQLQSIAATIADRLNAGAAERKVAVVDFVDLQGRPTELGRYLAEELSVALAGAATKFIVIDRTHLQALLQEHKLSASGLVDPQTARKLGELAGADTLITGTVTPFGDTVRISVKAIDVRTSALVTATASDLPRTKAVDELLSRSTGSPPSNGSDPKPDTKNPAPARDDVQTASADGFSVALQSCRRGAPPSAGISRPGATREVLRSTSRPIASFGGPAPQAPGRRPTGGDTITCRLVLTNQREDRTLFYFGNGTRAFDESGQEFGVSDVTVANARDRMITKTLISGVATQATVSFEGVPRSSSMFSSLEIKADNFPGPIKFRNVSIR